MRFAALLLHEADPNTLVMVIESSPTNLDPRVGIDAQSERIDSLIFDDLLSRGDNLNVAPGLAERWEIPDPLTYIFHLHHGVTFHDGRPLTSRDVKWTFDSLLSGKIRSTKAAAYRFVDHIDAPDDFTVVFHMKEPDADLAVESVRRRHRHRALRQRRRNDAPSHRLGAVQVRQRRNGQRSRHRAQRQILGRESQAGARALCRRARCNHPALELRKGSGDIAINSLTPDTVVTLAARSRLSRSKPLPAPSSPIWDSTCAIRF